MIPTKEQLRREQVILDQLALGQITKEEAAERITEVYRDRYEARGQADDYPRG